MPSQERRQNWIRRRATVIRTSPCNVMLVLLVGADLLCHNANTSYLKLVAGNLVGKVYGFVMRILVMVLACRVP